MDIRIGVILIVVKSKQSVRYLNDILSSYSGIIIGRQGIPLKDKGLNVISLVIEGTTDEFGSLTGKIGKIEGISVKSASLKHT